MHAMYAKVAKLLLSIHYTWSNVYSSKFQDNHQIDQKTVTKEFVSVSSVISRPKCSLHRIKIPTHGFWGIGFCWFLAGYFLYAKMSVFVCLSVCL